MTIGKRRKGRTPPEQAPEGAPVPVEETGPEERAEAETLPEETPVEESAAEAAEADPLAEERAALDRARAALEAERAEFARLRMESAVEELLRKRGLPAQFAPWLAAETAEESEARVEEFALRFREAVASAVTARLRGRGAPREPVKPGGYSREELRNLSRGEINARWEEIQRALQH